MTQTGDSENIDNNIDAELQTSTSDSENKNKNIDTELPTSTRDSENKDNNIDAELLTSRSDSENKDNIIDVKLQTSIIQKIETDTVLQVKESVKKQKKKMYERVDLCLSRNNKDLIIARKAYHVIYNNYWWCSIVVLLLSSITTFVASIQLIITNTTTDLNNIRTIEILGNILTLTFGVLITLAAGYIKFQEYQPKLEIIGNKLLQLKHCEYKLNNLYYKLKTYHTSRYIDTKNYKEFQEDFRKHFEDPLNKLEEDLQNNEMLKYVSPENDLKYYKNYLDTYKDDMIYNSFSNIMKTTIKNQEETRDCNKKFETFNKLDIDIIINEDNYIDNFTKKKDIIVSEFLDNTCYRKFYNLLNNLFCCICNYRTERQKNRLKRKQLNFAIDLTKEILNEIYMENSKNSLTEQDIINIKNASYIFAKNNNIGIQNDMVLHPEKTISSKKTIFINKIVKMNGVIT
tara:strand:+ start:2178 stop:3551 length:1374 start_codon:yes stop_codon:yes gene_type:complete